MPRESKQDLKKRVALIVKRLHKAFPEAGTALDHRTPVQLLVATILSAQCTDTRVNKVTPSLFARFPAAADLAGADRTELEELIRSTGFYRNKAKSIQGATKKIVEDFDDRVPETMEELLSLPGVARKTANVVLGNGFGKAVGVVVDTHVFRLSRRLGLSKGKNPIAVEKDLMEIVPKKEWIGLGNRLIYHGRATCLARKPRCESCTIESLCSRVGVKPMSTSSRPVSPARRPLRERIQGSKR